jgi:hypothetical protein
VVRGWHIGWQWFDSQLVGETYTLVKVAIQFTPTMATVLSHPPLWERVSSICHICELDTCMGLPAIYKQEVNRENGKLRYCSCFLEGVSDCCGDIGTSFWHHATLPTSVLVGWVRVFVGVCMLSMYLTVAAFILKHLQFPSSASYVPFAR